MHHNFVKLEFLGMRWYILVSFGVGSLDLYCSCARPTSGRLRKYGTVLVILVMVFRKTTKIRIFRRL